MRIVVTFAVLWLVALSMNESFADDREGIRTNLDESVTATSWSLLIEANMGVLHDSLATLGVRADATEEYDGTYDAPRPPNPPGDYVEVYFPHSGGNWPNLLGSKFSTDMTAPGSPRWMFIVESTVGSGTMTLSWDTSMINSLPSGYGIYLKDSTTGSVINIRSQSSYAFTYSGPGTFTVWSEHNLLFVSLEAKWNLVSVPLIVGDSSKNNLFSNSISDAFGFEGEYVASETLEAGQGYWLKFSSQQLIAFTGTSLSSVDVPVMTGWNIVGSVDHDIPAPSGGIIVSQFFSYENGYHTADTLKPGKAYWVKVNADGILSLGP